MQLFILKECVNCSYCGDEKEKQTICLGSNYVDFIVVISYENVLYVVRLILT